jgi:hypothetical protein
LADPQENLATSIADELGMYHAYAASQHPESGSTKSATLAAGSATRT